MAFGDQATGFRNQLLPLFEAGDTVVINGNGLFVYNGAPALGNLIASVAPVGGHDPFGNQYLAGTATYNSATGLTTNLLGGNISLPSLNASSLIASVAEMFLVDELAAGTAPAINISSPSGSGLPANIVILSIAGASQSLAVSPQVRINLDSAGAAATSALFEVDGTTAVQSIEAIVSGAAETWHAVTIPATWTGFARVKLMAEINTARFHCVITAPGAGATSGSFGTFPTSAYYPVNVTTFPLGFSGAVAGTNARMNVNASPTGPSFAGLPAGFTGTVSMVCDYPTD